MDAKKQLSFLSQTVQDEIKHKNYKRTVDLAEDYYSFASGVGISERFLIRPDRRVDEQTWEMVKKITQHIIPACVNDIMAVFHKIPRAITIDKSYIIEAEQQMSEMAEIEGEFWAGENVAYYLDNNLIQMSFTDPNAFILTDFVEPEMSADNTVVSRAKPFPKEIYSDMAYRYEYINGILVYLITRTEVEREYKEAGRKMKAKCFDFIMYTKERATILRGLPNKVAGIQSDGKIGQTTFENQELPVIQLNGKHYVIIQPADYNLENVPAIQIGYIFDLVTVRGSFVAPHHPAVPYFKKLVKTVSEMDITSAYHAFAQKIQAVRKCDNKECSGGKLPNGDVCPTCHGEGLKIATSATDVITIPIKDNKEEQLDLNNIIKYVSPSVDLLGWQSEYIDNNFIAAIKAVFNSETLNRQTVTKTATEQSISYQAIYDTLYPFANKYVSIWYSIINNIGQITELSEGLLISTFVSKDFQLKSAADYIDDIKKAKDAGVPFQIIEKYNQKLIDTEFEDSPEQMALAMTKYVHMPMTDKSEQEKMVLISSMNVYDPVRVLYVYFKDIFAKTLEANENFIILDGAKQREAIQEQVALKIEQLREIASADTPIITFE